MVWIIFLFSQDVWKSSCQGEFGQLPEQHLREVKEHLKSMPAVQNFQKKPTSSHVMESQNKAPQPEHKKTELFKISSHFGKYSSKQTPSASLFSFFSIGECEKKKNQTPNWSGITFFPVKRIKRQNKVLDGLLSENDRE